MPRDVVSGRSWLKGGAALAGSSITQVTFSSSALAQSGEEVIPWLDQPPPDTVDTVQSWENLDSWFTPSDRFFNVNHYGQPTSLDESGWQVEIGGRVARPYTLSLAEIRGRDSIACRICGSPYNFIGSRFDLRSRIADRSFG